MFSIEQQCRVIETFLGQRAGDRQEFTISGTAATVLFTDLEHEPRGRNPEIGNLWLIVAANNVMNAAAHPPSWLVPRTQYQTFRNAGWNCGPVRLVGHVTYAGDTPVAMALDEMVVPCPEAIEAEIRIVIERSHAAVVRRRRAAGRIWLHAVPVDSEGKMLVLFGDET